MDPWNVIKMYVCMYVCMSAGLPYVRPMPPIPAVAGQQLVVKCPVAGYPIDTIIWEKGKSQYYSSFHSPMTHWPIKHLPLSSFKGKTEEET
jgi:hypothetical protein